MYQNVRYPIMRVDIARIIILHCYGGLYSDLDVWPNRDIYPQVDFALARVEKTVPVKVRKSPRSGRGTQTQSRSRMMATQSTTTQLYMDMECVIASQGNPIMLEWLSHISNEIKNKMWRRPTDWYHTKRVRYVYHTTGPRSMERFLRSRGQGPVHGVNYLHCNYFKDESHITPQKRKFFDIISHQSNSYFTTAAEIRVPVGEGDQPFPPIGSFWKRMRSKSTGRLELTPPGGARDSTDEGSQRGPVGDSIHSEIEATASPSQGSQPKETHTPQTRLPANWPTLSPIMTPLLQPILASTGSAPDSAETNEARHTVDMISELKHYFLEHKRSVNTIVMLQSVSADLRKFITGSSAMPVAGPIKRKP
jgi:hypothetical protein